MSIIKVGYLISYDYEFLKISLPRVYRFVNEIYLAVDADRKTWAGEKVTIADEFWTWIKEFDVERKITIYEDYFYVPELGPMECETRERNLLVKQMGKADWYVQIDSDEYFVDFESFAHRLEKYKPTGPTTISCKVATLFKEIPSGYLLIDESVTILQFATNNPFYDMARVNASENKLVQWNDLVLHQSWARSAPEILFKLNNWGHKNDFNTLSFYKLWDAIDENNYDCLRNFHPLEPKVWPNLILFPGNITDVLDSFKMKEIKEPEAEPIKKEKPFLSRLWKKIRSK
eukprot:gene15391-18594_t